MAILVVKEIEFVAELRRPERQAEPHNHIGKKKPMN